MCTYMHECLLSCDLSTFVSRYFPASFETLGVDVHVSANACVIQDVKVYICVFTAAIDFLCTPLSSFFHGTS